MYVFNVYKGGLFLLQRKFDNAITAQALKEYWDKQPNCQVEIVEEV